MTSAVASTPYRFGRFELLPGERQLLADGAAVHLKAHTFDLLVALVERSGHLVSKDELLTRVWPRVVVEENSLQVHVSALRKVLGADAIATISGRGYRFALEVVKVEPPEARASPRKHNLPHPLTSFVGREAVIAELKQLLGGTRLLTLTGAGGCGKTRLAIELARQLTSVYRDGVWLVTLAPLADPALLPRTVASALDIKEEAGTPPIDTIAEHLASRALLLLLDNAEHLIDSCAQFAESLLQRCEQLVILVTSREQLGITGEMTYRVPSLAVPDEQTAHTPEAVAAYEAARLFIERARLQQPHFAITEQNSTAIASICRRLDGIALALELAAPRVRTLSVEELSHRLERRFDVLTVGSRTALPRHRTLRALIDWSYDLLSDAEKAMLRTVSVFAGGWTLQAAHRVRGGDETDTSSTLELLNSLADKSLILAEARDDDTRYGILDTVREYARDRLRELDEETQVQRQHLEYLLALAKEPRSKRVGAGHSWTNRLGLELDNMRAALSWSLSDVGDPANGLRLAVAINFLWHMRAQPSEGRSWMSRLLAALPPGPDDDVRANALCIASGLALRQDDLENAEVLAKQALASSREVGYQFGIGEALYTLAGIALSRHDFPASIALYKECLAAGQTADDAAGRALGALVGMGVSARELGDHAQAREWFEQAVALMREHADWRVEHALSELAMVDYLQHDHAGAKSHLAEAERIEREIGLPFALANSLTTRAAVAHDEGDFERARDSFLEALRLLRGAERPHHLSRALEGFAALMGSRQRGQAAARIWGAAERGREKHACPIQPCLRSWYQREVAAARAALGEEAFQAAWNEGRAMTPHQAVDFALEAAGEAPTNN